MFFFISLLVEKDICETFQLSFCVFVCAFCSEIPPYFFAKIFLFLFFPI
jgi:hypothetical protein